MTIHERGVGAPPQLWARIAGGLGLYIFVAAVFAEGVRGSVIESGDAALTAANIAAAEDMFRFGLAGELFVACADIALAVALYVLLRPVNRDIALLALVFRAATAVVNAASKVFLLTPLLLADGSEYLTVFDSGQLQALSMFSLKLHAYGYHIALIIFGFHILLIGYLISKAGYFPKLIGFMLMVAAFSYWTNSVASILDLPGASMLFPWVLLPPAIAEMSLTLWLLFAGVNVRRWPEKAAVES